MRNMIRSFTTRNLFLAAIAAAAPASFAAEIYVDAANATGVENGTQASPYRRVQTAVDAAAAGDEIRVAAGSYSGNVRVQGKALTLRGGYSKAWTRDLAANTTSLVGAGGDSVVSVIECDATIDGFRITGGTGSAEGLPYSLPGGGVYCRAGSPTILNNLIEGNDIRSTDPIPDYNYGGGLYISDAASAVVKNNVIRNNFAGRGGGLAVFATQALIQGNTVEGNTAVGDHGGGMFTGITSATITENVFRRNEVGRALGYGWGGGMIVQGKDTTAEISFNVVTENFAAAYGAGEFIDEAASASIHHDLVYRNQSKAGCEAVSAIAVDGGADGGSSVSISFCTIADNVCPDSIRGNGLQVEGNSTTYVSNCIFWNNGGDDFAVTSDSTLEVTFTCSQERFGGTGNINSDPKFVNESGNDFRLAAGSPCIDAADPKAPFANEPQPNGGRADMGRFGNSSEATPSGATSGTVATGNAAGGAATTPSNNTTNPANGNSGNTADDGQSALDAASSSGLCPASAGMLFSFSLMGMRRGRRAVK